VIAFRSLGTWRGEGPFGAWLSRIGVRVALRQVGRRRNVTWLDPLDADARSGDAAIAHGVPAPDSDPASHAVRAERSASIRNAVASLDEPYREVVALRFFAERSLAEIADETGRPLNTVKTHLHRGLAKLRDRLAGVDT
jgi:RNA polymerase sigma-70 factor (ECF subfamily)